MIKNITNHSIANIYGQNKVSKSNSTRLASDNVAINTPISKQSANINFGNAIAAYNSTKIRTTLSTKEENEKYNAVSSVLDKKTKKTLNELLKTGKLLNNDSNDKSTMLDNLYKIVQTKRMDGLNTTNILNDIIETIKYPYRITQKFGDIPEQFQNEIIANAKKEGKNITSMDLDVKSSTCPAASIQFNLAHKHPAEFTRMAADLTSEKMSVEKTIKINELSQGLTNTLCILNEFGTKHKLEDWNTLKVTLEPDKNALTRARIQTNYKDEDERSVIDVLMQSTFMNIGAQNTYESLTDKRTPKYNDDNSGLIDIEKNFAEELATGKGKVCVTYQKIDDNGKLVGYECEQNETLDHITSTLNKGENVIIGYTYSDEDNNIVGGHEITITGIETDKKGNKYFVCNDTDDGITAPIKYAVNELLPKIHHAGIPKDVLINKVEFVESWKELMEIYKNAKAQQYVQSA